eukprot:3853832-Amphidinium_carterae.2
MRDGDGHACGSVQDTEHVDCLIMAGREKDPTSLFVAGCGVLQLTLVCNGVGCGAGATALTYPWSRRWGKIGHSLVNDVSANATA